MTESTSPDKVLVGNVYQLVTGLGETQQLTISGNLAYGLSAKEMGQEFDKLIAVTSRLCARHKIEAKLKEIAADEAMIGAMESDLTQLDESKAPPGGVPMKLNAAEKQNREGIVRNIRHLKGRAAGNRKDLEELQKEAE